MAAPIKRYCPAAYHAILMDDWNDFLHMTPEELRGRTPAEAWLENDDPWAASLRGDGTSDLWPFVVMPTAGIGFG